MTNPQPKIELGEPIPLNDIMQLPPEEWQNKVFKVLPNQQPLKESFAYGPLRTPSGVIILTDIVAANGSRRPDMSDYVYAYGVDEKGPLGAIDKRMVVALVPEEELKQHEKLLLKLRMEALERGLRTTRHKSKIGADPEIFAVKANGEVLPAFEFLPEKTKAKTKKLHDRSFANAYWDGYQAEYSVCADTCGAFAIDSIAMGLRAINDAAVKAGGSLTLRNTMTIPAERLQKDEGKYVNFGCSPSKSAYGDKFPPVEPREVPFRSAGGHIHFEFRPYDKDDILKAVKLLDRVLGVISVAMFRHWDTPQRRALYGRAGEYRTPVYGFEYRVLSNAWLCNPAIAHYVYELARMCVGQVMYNSTALSDAWNVTEEEAIACINGCNVELALKLLARNDAVLEIIIAALPVHIHNSVKTKKLCKDIILEGAHKFLRDPDQPSKLWFGSWVRHSGTPKCTLETACRHFSDTYID